MSYRQTGMPALGLTGLGQGPLSDILILVLSRDALGLLSEGDLGLLSFIRVPKKSRHPDAQGLPQGKKSPHPDALGLL